MQEYYIVLGDFSIKSEIWQKHDKTSYKGAKIDALNRQFRLQQIIKDATHILAKSSPCIYLIFTPHQNLVMEFGVQLSFHPNYHHQITFAKFSLNIHYPPHYEREIW